MLNEEGGSPQVVNGKVEEALELLDVEVHGDDVGHAGLGEHGGQQLGRDAAPLSHLALLGVREEWDHA